MADTPLCEGDSGSSSASADRNEHRPGTGRVAICDDEMRLAALMAGLLAQHGYEGVPAASGAELLGLFSSRHPRFDAVVLDVHLAGEDTGAVLRELAERTAVPVILSSGYGEDDVPRDLRELPNVRGYLGKPYTADRLVAVLKQIGAHGRPT